MARKSLTTATALPRMMAFVREDLGEALAAMQAPASKARAKAPKKAARWVPSEWYRKAVAADRAAETRANRTAARPKSPRANAQAVQYARFLARRDGVALPEHTEGHVCWRQCEHGWRPHRVALWEVKVDHRGYHGGRVGREPVADIDLPNWDAAWEVVVDLSEPAPALAIAA